MSRRRFIRVFLIGFICVALTSVVSAREPVRIDASSTATAQASYELMNSELAMDQRQKLAVAVVEINLIGVKSAKELSRGDGNNLGIQRIKDRVAGMTADEIIKYAAENTSVHVRVNQP